MCGNMRLRLGQHKCAGFSDRQPLMPCKCSTHELDDGCPLAAQSCTVRQLSRLRLQLARRLAMGLSTVAGWGAFLHAPARKDQLLGEYTGELITQAEADRRFLLDGHACCWRQLARFANGQHATSHDTMFLSGGCPAPHRLTS